MRALIVLALTVMFVLTATVAMAATATSPLTASASVPATCRITSVTNLNFGTYDTTDSANNDNGVGNVKFRCTKNTGYDVYITGTRQMVNGPDVLTFQMYQEVARTTVWSSATPGVTGTASSNAEITKDIYGRIPALQDVPANAYTGTVTVTIQY